MCERMDRLSAFIVFLICAVLVNALVYYLWLQGFITTKSLIAILFAFRPGKQSDRVYLDSCTGWLRHGRQFHQSVAHEFFLDCKLSQGDVEVSLLDSQKQELFRLNRQKSAIRIELRKGARYYLLWEFENASGQCELHW